SGKGRVGEKGRTRGGGAYLKKKKKEGGGGGVEGGKRNRHGSGNEVGMVGACGDAGMYDERWSGVVSAGNGGGEDAGSSRGSELSVVEIVRGAESADTRVASHTRLLRAACPCPSLTCLSFVIMGCLCRARLRTFACFFFFFSSRRRHTRLVSDWSSDVCSSD